MQLNIKSWHVLSVELEGRSTLTQRNFRWFSEVQDWAGAWDFQGAERWCSTEPQWHLQET